MKLKIATQPDLSATSPVHQQALADGEEHFRRWQRNVIDRYKDWSEEDIRAELQMLAHPFAVCMENLIGDFNLSTIIRNANAFNAKEVYYLGIKKLDLRGAQGSHHYTNIRWLSTVAEFMELKEKYVVIGIDNVAGATSLYHYSWKPNTLMVFGSEGVGLTPEMQSMCEEMVYIPQYGSIRSLNVGTASGIIMNDFVSKFRHYR